MPFSDNSSWLGFPQLVGVLAAYALGCVNTGYYIVRWKTGQDLRKLGSGNAGAKNVGRVLGSWGFATSFVGDIAKGALAVWGAQQAGYATPALSLVLLAVIIGHIWPVQLGFHGGKGMSTSFGALLFFDPIVAGVLFVFCVMLLAVTRRFTLSALGAYALSPVVPALRGEGLAAIATLLVFASLVLFAHRDNLRAELSRGTAGSST
jgi:glycerol-3-phosphate acyltransferase PlsY